ncbi:MAG: hypothetical protein WC714_28480 [Candidatus Obscuribacterales bacterium]|jgi:hypothetical protein
MEALTLTNNSTATKRRELDFYPTPPEVTHALMDFLKLEPCTIWEPACGDGAMADVLYEHGHKVIATDIRDTGYSKGVIDFLISDYDCDAIITNPPFNISEEFIRHALTKAPIVAMVLKSQYWHAKKRVELFEQCPPAYVLPLSWRPDFLFDQRKEGDKKAAPTMEVAWTVWIKGDTDTKYRILSKRK